ncbi:MAG: hypothetical protein PHN75_17315 [Syntrophales bacterium]|nr:hypothetical protein [Syntrophales bacterium]
MNLNVEPRVETLPLDVAGLAGFIAGIQKENGEIPWSVGGKTDPWDHIESAMGLSVAGYYRQACKAYDWMVSSQQPDGSWWSAHRDGKVEDWTRESNFAAYIAVGVFHHYLITGDKTFLQHMWQTVSAGIGFILSMQAPSGEIYWAKNREGVVDKMSLLTGSSSIYMSLKCALAIAAVLGKRRPVWHAAWVRLGDAIRNYPNHFNMIKSRFSMDWYYPVLCGAVTAKDAVRRVEKYWEKFAVPGWGIRCVSDRPWVTMAETSELVLALTSIDAYDDAETVFSWLMDKRYDDGSFWMGVTFPDKVIWPEEKTGWTAAAVLLAYDALNDLTPASRLFHHGFWRDIWRDLGKDFQSC